MGDGSIIRTTPINYFPFSHFLVTMLCYFTYQKMLFFDTKNKLINFKKIEQKFRETAQQIPDRVLPQLIILPFFSIFRARFFVRFHSNIDSFEISPIGKRKIQRFNWRIEQLKQVADFGIDRF